MSRDTQIHNFFVLRFVWEKEIEWNEKLFIYLFLIFFAFPCLRVLTKGILISPKYYPIFFFFYQIKIRGKIFSVAPEICNESKLLVFYMWLCESFRVLYVRALDFRVLISYISPTHKLKNTLSQTKQNKIQKIKQKSSANLVYSYTLLKILSLKHKNVNFLSYICL